MAMIVDDNGHVLLQQRPPTGIWGGLWSLPEFGSTVKLGEHLRSKVGATAVIETWPEVAHGFTHFQLAITPVKVTLSARISGIADDRAERWVNPSTLPDVGLAAPVSKLLSQLAE